MDEDPVRERVALGAAGCVDGPPDRAVGLLPAQDEVDARLNGRPQLAQELHIARDEVVVPRSRGQVGAHVGVEPLILDPGPLVVVEPAPIGQLAIGQPAVGRHGLVGEPAGRQGHGRFDVVPRVAVAALEPRDHPVGPLQVGDGVRVANTSEDESTPGTSGTVLLSDRRFSVVTRPPHGCAAWAPCARERHGADSAWSRARRPRRSAASSGRAPGSCRSAGSAPGRPPWSRREP